MEQKLRMHIASMETKKETSCFTEKIKEEIMMDPNVQFIWHLLSTEWKEEIHIIDILFFISSSMYFCHRIYFPIIYKFDHYLCKFNNRSY